MPSSKRLSKADKRFQKAIDAIDRFDVSRRKAARIAGLPFFNFQYRLIHRHDPPKLHSYLTPGEEQVLVELVNHYSSQSFPLYKEDTADTAEILVKSLSLERQQKLPFVDGRSGKKFLRNFVKRHKENIRFRRSVKEEEARCRSCNAETLTTHMVSLGKIIEENQIDSMRICNLDVSGMSPNKDCLQSDKRKAYHTRSTKPQQRAPGFRNIDHVSMMPVIFANGICARPLFVIKGKQLKCQVTRQGTEEVIETLSNCFPQDSLSVLREDVAGINSDIFYQWAQKFTRDCAYLTCNGRKVLLVMDGGMTQPLDVCVFAPFKEPLRNLVESLSDPGQTQVYSAFDFLKLVRRAYDKSFTRSNIETAFKKTGILPLDWQSLITVPRPLSHAESKKLITVEEIAELIGRKREMLRANIGLQPVVIRGRYLDTREGLCLTSPEALQKAREKDQLDKAKRAEAAKKEALKAEKEAKQRERTRQERIDLQLRALSRRVLLYNVPDVLPRPMSVRRTMAKRRLAERRAEARRC